MSNKVNAYYAALEELAKAKAKIKKLEGSSTLQQQIELRNKLEDLKQEYNVDNKQIAKILGLNTQVIPIKKNQSIRESRVYLNPHTKEKIITRGANHKLLKEWKKQYGDDTVAKWVQH